MTSAAPTLSELKERLSKHGQDHVLRFWDELDEEGKNQLAGQLADVDLDQLDRLTSGSEASTDFGELARRANLPTAVSSDGSGVDWSLEDARKRGEEALRAGEIATVIVAGGQGTRLGFDQPKVMYPIGPVSGRTLFQVFADRILATQARYATEIPLYVMTSDATNEATIDYLESNAYLGLKPEQVVVFKQGTMPAVDDQSGKLLLASKDSLALSPDGHGGTLRALDRSGCLKRMVDGGQKHLFYFQVDNPLVDLCDPVFIGHHLLSNSEMTSEVIRKRYPTEKVGNVVEIDGRTQIIEYSDLPDEVAELRDESGGLRLWAGSIAVHLFDVQFLQRMAASDSSLAFHQAHKKVPYLNEQGELVAPASPNATKFERFIFDLLPSAERPIICEVQPEQSFAPVKNAAGAETDTAELAQTAISNLHRGWVEAAGGSVAEDAKVEISAKHALDADEFKAKQTTPVSITKDCYFD